MKDNKETSTSRIQSVTFIKGVTGTDPIVTDGKLHVVFIGRSNVGKSSTLNILAGGKDIARTSKTPGKTTELNFYLINNRLYFVDLPGYGYAKISARRAEKMRKHLLWYFAESGAPICLAVLIIDAQAGVTRKDEDMLDILAAEDIPTLVTLNKIDKLNQKETHTALKAVKETLRERGIGSSSVIPFSARTGKGSGELLRLVLDC